MKYYKSTYFVSNCNLTIPDSFMTYHCIISVKFCKYLRFETACRSDIIKTNYFNVRGIL